MRRRVERGEAELFVALTGAERMVIGPGSDEVVRRWTADATPTVCVSNVGVIPGPLPSSFRGFTVTHAPTPNQSLFFVVTTVGGRINAILTYDRSRIAVDGACLAKSIEARIVALAENAQRTS